MKNSISFPGLNLNFRIDRVAFSLFGIEIYWYGIIILLAVALASAYANFEFKKKSLDTNQISDLLLFGVPVSIFFARAYYVLFKTKDFSNMSLFEFFNVRNGGIAIYGALFGALLTGYTYTKIKNVKMTPILDIFAVSMLIGQSIGRFGNFVNCEAYGSKTSSILRMCIEGEVFANSVHPTFLYESFWNILGIFFINLYKKISKFDGELFLVYMVWYGSGRFLIEGLRADSLFFKNFRISQLVSLALLKLGFVIILITRNKNTKKSFAKGAENKAK